MVKTDELWKNFLPFVWDPGSGESSTLLQWFSLSLTEFGVDMFDDSLCCWWIWWCWWSCLWFMRWGEKSAGAAAVTMCGWRVCISCDWLFGQPSEWANTTGSRSVKQLWIKKMNDSETLSHVGSFLFVWHVGYSWHLELQFQRLDGGAPGVAGLGVVLRSKHLLDERRRCHLQDLTNIHFLISLSN